MVCGYELHVGESGGGGVVHIAEAEFLVVLCRRQSEGFCNWAVGLVL